MRRSFGLFVLTLAALACLASCNPEVGQARYTWTDDGECTGISGRNGLFSRAFTETVQGVYSVVYEPSCTNTGAATYTATFQSELFSTQVKDVSIPINPDNHYIGVASYTWNGTQCTASAPCTLNAQHAATTETVQAVAGSVVEDTVCYTVTNYNATFANPAFAAQTKEFESSKQSHEFVSHVCTKCGYCDIFELHQNSYLTLKSGCSAPANLRIPRMGVGIVSNLFSYNTTLTSVVIQSNIKVIDGHAFKYCTNLASLELPVGLLAIGNNAFEQCTSLPSIDLPQGLKVIGSAAFHTCSAATGTLTIPSSVYSLGISAFGSCSGLEELVIENGLHTIESWVFNTCTGLEQVTLPVSVTSIGEGAFSGCTSLADIYYAGTRAQWNNVSKGSNWNNNCPANMVIHCSDD